MAINFDTAQELPLEGGLAFQQFDTVLGDQTFTIKQRWNTRDAAWYLDLIDASGLPIFSGIKLVLGIALGRRVTDPRMPGVFIAADFEGTDTNPSRDATFDD